MTDRSAVEPKIATTTMGNPDVAHEAYDYHDDRVTDMVDCYYYNMINQKNTSIIKHKMPESYE